MKLSAIFSGRRRDWRSDFRCNFFVGSNIGVDEFLPVSLAQAKERLEQLESTTSQESKVEVTQQELLSKLDSMHSEMVAAWHRSERVIALRIVIKVCVGMQA